jgi:hypothetical protein
MLKNKGRQPQRRKDKIGWFSGLDWLESGEVPDVGLEFEVWDLFGFWGLTFGISPKGI